MGAKPTAFSQSARDREMMAEQTRRKAQEVVENKKKVQAIGSDISVLPELKVQLHKLQEATRTKNRPAIEEAVSKARSLDQQAVARQLSRILKANEEDLGVPAALLMGKLKIRSDLRVLFERLVGADIFMAQAAAEALGDIGDPAAASQLTDQAKRHTSVSVRSAALEALGRIGERSVLPSILDTVHDLDPSVRESAARLLGKLGNPQEHREILSTLQKDPSPQVRLVAVLSLAELRAPEAVDNLVDLLADSSEEIRRSAEAALTTFPDRVAVRRKLMDALEEKSGSALLSYSEALKGICDCSCWPELLRIAEHTKKPIVRNACEALAQQIKGSCGPENR